MIKNPLTAIDFYKADHRRQYPEGTTEVYSNLTARSAKHAKSIVLQDFNNKVVFFGLQYFIKEFLIETWNEGFFKKDKKEVVKFYQRVMSSGLGMHMFDCKHIEDLHDLGYLPIKIKALPEGNQVPIGVPMLTIVNTHPDFFWLTNYLESVMSAYLWKPCTVATIAFEYHSLLNRYAYTTCGDDDYYPEEHEDLVCFQGHDFSFRGMSGLEDAGICGLAHCLSFLGTDCVPAFDVAYKYYNNQPIIANFFKENILTYSFESKVGCSVPATEHSVMCMGTKDDEIGTFKRLITETYPSGIVSIVSDTWDFWKVMTEYLPELKETIINREGKVVIRPDSGDPIKIICGDSEAKEGTPEHKGALELLWDTFGGKVNGKGYKELDEHIGLIYGDSITLNRAESILRIMRDKGFASTNIVLGIGSYTYQYITRDTFGFAVKATSGVVNDERRNIFKDPITDDGTKKSAKGLLKVSRGNYSYISNDGYYPFLHLDDEVSEEQEKEGYLEVVFEDGKLIKEYNLEDIRKALTGSI